MQRLVLLIQALEAATMEVGLMDMA